MTTYLVTGGTGSIGSALVRRLLINNDLATVRVLSRDDSAQHDMKMALPDWQRNRVRFILGDVRNRDTVRLAVSGVDRVFHCAAMKHVIGANYNAAECVEINAEGTSRVLEAVHTEAHYTGRPISFVLLSTDKAANPSNIMGASKFCAEQIVMRASWCCEDVRRRVVRFGNVFDSRGSVFPTFLHRIANKQSLQITDPFATRYVISIDDAVETLIHASSHLPNALINERLADMPFICIPRMRAANVDDIAKYAVETAGKMGVTHAVRTEFIGLQPGEKTHEECLTAHEVSHIIDFDDKYVYVNDELPGTTRTSLHSLKLTALLSSRNAPRADVREYHLYESLK